MTVKYENVEQLRTACTRLRRQNTHLRHQLEETRQMLEAIRQGAVDALVIERDKEPQVFTLQGAERPFRTVVETMNEGAVTMTWDGLILYCNQRFADILALPLNEVVGRRMTDFLSQTQADSFTHMKDQLHEHSARGELTLTVAAGRDVAVYAALSLLEDTDIRSICMVVTDISEFKRISKQRLEEALRAGHVVAFEWNPITDHVTRSENASELFGYDAAAGTGAEHFSLVHPDDRGPLFEKVNSLTGDRPQYRHHYRLLFPDGRVKWVEESAKASFDQTGKMVRLHGLFADITERRQTEEALRRAQSVARMGSWMMNVKTNVLTWSPETYRIFGVRQGTGLTYDSFIRIVHPADRAAVERAWQNALDTRTNYAVQHRIIVKGAVKWIQETSELEFDTDGSLLGAFGTAQDITELKERTAEAEEGERLLNAIMEYIPVGLTIVEADARIRAISRSALELMGRTREEIGHLKAEEMKELWQVLLPQDGVMPTGELPITEAIQEGRIVKERELAIQSKQNVITPVLATAAPIENSSGEIEGGIFVWQDISIRKQTEQSLQQSRHNLLDLKEQLENKNKELESIIGIVSHDLRAPLVSISGFNQEIRLSCQIAEKALQELGLPHDNAGKLQAVLSKEIPESVDYVQSSASKMDTLVRSLVKVARAGMAETRPEPLDMNRLVSEAAAAIRFEIKQAGAEVEIEPLPECFADKTQISQIFSNLLDNAVKYLDASRPGRIRITGCTDKMRSVYCIEDNGVGIASRYLDQIFDLFSRVDRTGKEGEGIGLAMVKRMTARNNGSIWVESEVGKGSKFCVSLPQFEPI